MGPKFRSSLMTVCLLAVFWAGLAQAHAKLVSADPAPDAMTATPQRIHLEFSAELAKSFSSFRLTGADGKAIALMPRETPDKKALEAVPTMPLRSGLYTVSWTAVSTDDAHKTTGSYRFTVQ